MTEPIADPQSTEELAPERPLPDRLSTNPKSPFYDDVVLQREVGVRFNGVEKNNIEEYCVSEGWVKIAAGKARDRHGNPLTIQHKGVVEPYFRHVKPA